jgi:branched-chain amino acid aminotransferase
LSHKGLIRTPHFWKGYQTKGYQTEVEKFKQDEVGLFETLRVYNGRIFREKEHLDRLLESARSVGYSFSLNPPQISKALHDALKASEKSEATLRLTVIENEIFVIVGERKTPASLYRTGVALRTSPVVRSLPNAASPEVKTSAYHNAVLASLEPKADEIYEWVFLSKNGFVTEVRIGNLFIVTQAEGDLSTGETLQMLTPPSDGILNGVTRRVVLECASRLRIPAAERPLTRHEIYNAAEAFLTNTSWEILPIRELDGRKIGTRIPGPLTWKLHQAFKEKVKKECRA